MKQSFSKVVIIYNPNSTGNGEDDAKKLRQALVERSSRSDVELLKTERAGHAMEIGEAYAKVDDTILLISASGDGGYNELVNGVLRHPTKQLTVTVLPSGNANDHFESTAEANIADRITDGYIRYIDVLSVTATKNAKPWHRYAHSYVGLGVTAYIGEKLTEAKLNYAKEKWLIAKFLIKFNYISARLDQDNRYHRYSSIVVGNIDRMSKVINLDHASAIDDGLGDLYLTRVKSTLGLAWMLIQAKLVNLKKVRSAHVFTVEVKQSTKIQCDGEVDGLDSGMIKIEMLKRRLRILK